MNLGPFSVCCMKKFFTLFHDAIMIVIGPSISDALDSWQSSGVWSYNHTLTFTTFGPPNYFKFLRNHKVRCLLLSAVSYILIFSSFEAIPALEVTDGITFGPGITLLQWWAIGFVKLSGAGFKEFCCISVNKHDDYQ
jgi:hypothetical protein